MYWWKLCSRATRSILVDIAGSPCEIDLLFAKFAEGIAC